jgi:hypothetical protein
MPVKKVTSVMFGGPNLDILFVTSMAKPPLPRFPGDGQHSGNSALHAPNINNAHLSDSHDREGHFDFLKFSRDRENHCLNPTNRFRSDGQRRNAWVGFGDGKSRLRRRSVRRRVPRGVERAH